LSPAFAGIICINSITTPSSTLPQVGTLNSLGFATGPFVCLNNPRVLGVMGTAMANLTAVFGAGTGTGAGGGFAF
jgi:hypothetical protein